MLSSYEDVPIPQGICFAGEVGFSGEIRAVNRIEQRIAEAENWDLKRSSSANIMKGHGKDRPPD